MGGGVARSVQGRGHGYGGEALVEVVGGQHSSDGGHCVHKVIGVKEVATHCVLYRLSQKRVSPRVVGPSRFDQGRPDLAEQRVTSD